VFDRPERFTLMRRDGTDVLYVVAMGHDGLVARID
jgi:hypothetical protein